MCSPRFTAGCWGRAQPVFQVDCGVAHNGQVQHLATASASVSAEIVERPMDRVRGFVRLYRPQMCLVAGEIVADATPAARTSGLHASWFVVGQSRLSPTTGPSVARPPASADVMTCAPARRPTSDLERAGRRRRSDRRGRRRHRRAAAQAAVPVVAVARDRERLEQLSATDEGITACPADIGDDSSGEAIAAAVPGQSGWWSSRQPNPPAAAGHDRPRHPWPVGVAEARRTASPHPSRRGPVRRGLPDRRHRRPFRF